MKRIWKVMLTTLCILALLISCVAYAGEASEEPKPTEKPAEKVTEKPAEKVTEKPAEKVTEKPTEKVTEKPTEKPTETSTEKPAEQSTEKPAEQPTEKPTETSTEKPTETSTEKPEEQPKEEPTDKPTEENTQKPAENPTQSPTDTPTEKPASTVVPVPDKDPTQKPEEDSDDDRKPEKLQAKLKDISRYTSEKERAYATLYVSGGTAPYVVKCNDKTYNMSKAGRLELSCRAKRAGTLEIYVVVKDANGERDDTAAKVPVAKKDKGDGKSWIGRASALKSSLTGEWHQDILKIARSQLGYHEYSDNFIINDEGFRKGWTVYGDLFGYPYEDWCAMFASFCIRYAGIDQADYPWNISCYEWMKDLRWLGVYEDDEDAYIPMPGDLIFFSWSGKNNDPDHVGIVESVKGQTVNTIEGNYNSVVGQNFYALYDRTIIGYGNTQKMYELSHENKDVWNQSVIVDIPLH